MKVLIVNHNHSEVCGVHAHGKRMFEILHSFNPEIFSYLEANSKEEAQAYISSSDIVIFNYYPGLMPWVHSLEKSGKFIGLLHEITQESVNGVADPFFDLWLVANNALDLTGKDSRWVKTIRPLLPFGSYTPPSIPTIGSFGFAFHNKGFPRLVEAVCSEFEEAIINLHITQAYFNDGAETLNAVINNCRSKVTKPGTQLNITTHRMSDSECVNWLGTNSINCLFYDHNTNRGLSSAVDYCISSSAPLLLTPSEQFKHVNSLLPCYPSMSIKDALILGNQSVLDLQHQWSPKVFYNQILEIINI